jgi:hypothetical protein
MQALFYAASKLCCKLVIQHCWGQLFSGWTGRPAAILQHEHGRWLVFSTKTIAYSAAALVWAALVKGPKHQLGTKALPDQLVLRPVRMVCSAYHAHIWMWHNFRPVAGHNTLLPPTLNCAVYISDRALHRLHGGHLPRAWTCPAHLGGCHFYILVRPIHQ